MAKRKDLAGRDIDWEFFTFPVAYAAASGAFVGIFLFAFLGQIGFVIALFAFSFGTAHFISQAARNRSARRRRSASEEEETERRALAARATHEAGVETRRRRRRRTR